MPRRALAALAVAGLLLAAGCSDDDATSATTSTTVAAVDGTTSTTAVGAQTDASVVETTAPPATTGDPSDPSDPGDDPADPGDEPVDDHEPGSLEEMLEPTPDDPAPGGLPPVAPSTPVRLASCERAPDGTVTASVELDNVSDLPIEAWVEVLVEDLDARPLARVVGTFGVVEAGGFGIAEVTTEEPVDAEEVSCLVIGLDLEERGSFGDHAGEDLPFEG